MRIICSKCKEFLESNRIGGSNGYCKDCHAEWMRNNRRPFANLNDEQKKKQQCRTTANVFLKRGVIVKQPCSNCGNQKSEMHHEDYDKPTEVIWLCRGCHLDLHLNRNKQPA